MGCEAGYIAFDAAVSLSRNWYAIISSYERPDTICIILYFSIKRVRVKLTLNNYLVWCVIRPAVDKLQALCGWWGRCINTWI